MGSSIGTVVFRVLLGILALELVYVGGTMLRPEPATEHRMHAREVAVRHDPDVAATPPSTPVVVVAPSSAPARVAPPVIAAASAHAAGALPTVPSPALDASPAIASPAPTAVHASPHAAVRTAYAPRPAPHAADAAFANATAFRYDGRWEHVSARDDGRPDGRSSRSFHPGARAVLAFTGRFVRLYGVVGPGGGRGVVDVDGRDYSVVSFGARAKRPKALVYASPRLAPGRHRLTIAVAPAATAGRGRYVNIAGAGYGD